MSQPDPLGIAGPSSGSGDINALEFFITRLMNGANHSTLVQVIACTNDGGLSEVGFVDVKPLVNQLDGYGHPMPHGTIYHIPYGRMQGGQSAIIIDPVPGDIGMAVFADRDISAVCATQAAANPATPRRFDWSDGMYFGGFRNGIPSQYVQFLANAQGINLVSPVNITMQAPVIDLVGQVNQSGGVLNVQTDAVIAGLSTINHNHGGIQPGTGISGAMQN